MKTCDFCGRLGVSHSDYCLVPQGARQVDGQWVAFPQEEGGYRLHQCGCGRELPASIFEANGPICILCYEEKNF